MFIFYRITSSFIKKGEIVALMHHSVGPGDWQFTVRPELFRWQIEYLIKHKFVFITAEELRQILKGQKVAPRRAVLLTFDDGYYDFVSHVLPILKEFNLPSIVFVHADRSSERLGNDLPLLSWEDICYIKKYRVEIGNHSYSHPDLKTLSSEELRSEISKSKEVFLKEISKHPKFFAFPGGRYNQNVVDSLRDNNYELAFTINPYLVNFSHDYLKIPRIGVIRNTGKIEFMARTTCANDWYQNLVGVLFGGKLKK